MKIRKLFFILAFLLIGISFCSAYSFSDYSYTQYTGASSFSGVDLTSEQCESGQDFIIQIEPFGCEPSVVRSDLLEEQNVPIFCKLNAIQLNPLIDVETIDSISFSGQYPREVSGIGFHPSQSALGYKISSSDSIYFDNIGYVVITLRQQENESALTNCESSDLGGDVCWVEGNLTARIRYDIENAFGIGKANFYLPLLSDSEWNSKINQYSFWDGRGYLRADSISDDSAVISIYSGSSSGFSGSTDKTKVASKTISVGETSSRIYMPNFDPCMANLKIKLNSLENPDTLVVLKVNDDVVEVTENERFLDGNCYVSKINELGLSQGVTIVCREDDSEGFLKSSSFDLRVEPKIKLDISGDEGEYEIGDYLYSDEEGKFVYLAYAGTEDDTELTNDLYVYFISIPESAGDRLGDTELEAVSKIVDGYRSNKNEKKNIGSFLKEGAKFYRSIAIEFYDWLVDGEGMSETLEFGKKINVGGKEISIIGFGDGIDIKESSQSKETFENYYGKASEDYTTIVESYSGEREFDYSETTFGEDAFYQKIVLARDTKQMQEMTELCDEFRNAYPDSEKNLDFCEDYYRISNAEVSTQDVLINGNVKRISFIRVKEPTYEEYGAEIYVKTPEGEILPLTLRKDELIYLSDDGEYIQLKSIDEDSADVEVYLKSESALDKVSDVLSRKTDTLELNVAEGLGKGYQFTLKNINLKKYAKVSVIPNIDYTETEADFQFKVGVEKRAFQLTPEKTQERIDNLNNSINKWGSISEGLKSTLKVMNAGCIATGGYLTLQNFVKNAGGKAYARQKVMEGYWKEECADLEYGGEKYVSVEDCYLENAELIDEQVQLYTDVLQAQNDDIQTIQEGHTSDGNLLKAEQVDTDAFMNEYSKEVISEVSGLSSVTNSKGKTIDLTNVAEILNNESWKNNNYEIEDLRDIEFYTRVLKADPNDELAKDELYKLISQVQENAEDDLKKDAVASVQGIGSKDVLVISVGEDKVKEYTYRGLTQGDISTKISGIEATTPVQIVYDNLGGENYIVVLNEPVQKQYSIKRIEIDGEKGKEKVLMIYDYSGNLVTDTKVQNEFGKIYFKSYDENSYSNEWIDPEVIYFETEPYKGYPAIVPVEPESGWYVATKQSGIAAYDESGRVSSFWLCNVGENGVAEFNSGIGDDICRQVNTFTSEPYDQFPGLDESEATRLIKKASCTGLCKGAIEEAQDAYRDGVSKVCLSGDGTRECYSVGNPAALTSEIQCTDFMSPKECNILFNVCDPVVCPSSRCDFGGNYPVQDVVQSGIIGSIALCLPNYKEGIKVPICLTGVQAGIDNWVTVQKSYRDCLQTSLDTGETVGICDEIHSIYMCEFFWEQALPLAKLTVPKIVATLLGQNSHGGAEYLSLSNAWANAKSSVNYMTQYYAANAYNAFKYRSTDEIGSAVCKSFASLTYPNGVSILDSMTEPESPAQFSGKFEEIEYTTTTNPPISQYKVYYYIYAGNDRGAYYSIYLTEGEESSFYQDTSYRRQVDSGYIPVGEYASETIDFTAPSGYQKLCIEVNGQEECGFKQVSTSFATNYVEDLYRAQIANQTDVTTETGCVSGEISLYSLLNLNLQESASELVDAQIYQEGITRICSTDNPGLGTDVNADLEGSRWIDVGYCGDSDIRCWIDMESVEDAIEFVNIEESVVSSLEEQLAILATEGDYITDEEFKSKLEEFEGLTDTDEKLNLIEEIYDKVFYNKQKAKLLLLRGNVYAQLALEAYNKYIEDLKTKISEDSSSLSCGEMIYEKAKYYADVSYDHVRSDGELDNPCASFVSKVLSESGVDEPDIAPSGFYCQAIDILISDVLKNENYFEELYTYDNYNKGKKLPELQKGDIVVFGNKNLDDDTQHATIFAHYSSDESQAYVYGDPGESGPVALKSYTIADEDGWHISYVYRNVICSSTEYENIVCGENDKGLCLSPDLFFCTAGFAEDVACGLDYKCCVGGYSALDLEGNALDENDFIFVSPTFEFKDGLTTWYGNVNYKYFEGKWYWSFSDNLWVDLENNFDSENRELADTQKELVSALKEQETFYYEGLNVLMSAVLGKDAGVLFGWKIFEDTIFESHPSLKTENVEMDYEGVFEFNEITGLNEEPIYFKYDEQWFANFAGKNYRDNHWFPVLEIVFDEEDNKISWGEKSVVGVSVSTDVLSLVELLKTDAFEDGARLIFNTFYSTEELGEDFDSEEEMKINSEIDSSQFSEKQLNIIQTADNCKDCKANSYGSVCNKELCEAIGIQIGEYCEYFAGSDFELATCTSKGDRPEEKKELSQSEVNSIVADIDKLIEENGLMTKLNSNDELENFVKGLWGEEVLTESEYRDFSGEGEAFSFENAETLGELRNFFKTGSKSYTIETAFEMSNVLFEEYGDDTKIPYIPEANSFVYLLAEQDVLTEKEKNDLLGIGGVFEFPEKLSDLKELLGNKLGSTQKEKEAVEVVDNKIDFCDTTLLQSEANALEEFVESNNLENIDVCDFISIEDNSIYLINFRNSEIKDITSLKSFPKLETLNLANNEIVDVSALANLENLKEINLYQNKITDISPLENLKNLEILEVGNNCLEADYYYLLLVSAGVNVGFDGNPREDC